MLVDFSKIEFDKYGNIEPPTLILKYLDGRVQSSIGFFQNFKPIFRYNDVSEFTVDVPAYSNGINVPYYDELVGFKLIEFEPFGDFVIVSANKHKNGIQEYKTIKAYSLEYMFNFKQLNLPKGTYNFYNPVDNKDSIITIILELMPDWKVGTIDRELWGRWRTFDSTDSKLYPFIMDTVQDVYNCLFLFDVKNKVINVISANRKTSNSPIHMSFQNLIKNIDIEELSEEIVTVLAGYGSDDMSIAYVNPNGTDKIYNLDWLILTNNLSEDLAQRWLTYKANTDFYQQVFSNLNALYIEKSLSYQLAETEVKIIQVKIDAIDAAIIAGKTDNTVEGWDENLAKLEKEKEELELQKKDKEDYVKKCLEDKVTVEAQIDEILNVCKLTSFFTKEELTTLSMYFKEDSIVESSFVIPQYNSAFNGTNSSSLTERNEAIVSIKGAIENGNNLAELFETDESGNYVAFDKNHNLNLVEHDRYGDVSLSEGVAQAVVDQLNEDQKKIVYSLRGGVFSYSQKYFQSINGVEEVSDIEVEGDIIDASFHYNLYNLSTYEDESSPDMTKQGFFILSVSLKNAKYITNKAGSQPTTVAYPSMNITMQGNIDGDAPRMNDDFLGFRIKNGTFYNTAAVTESQRQTVYQELYDYVQDALKKLSEPSYQFDIDSANYIFDIDFYEFTKHTKLGNTISLDIGEDSDIKDLLYPILIELSLNYENPADFKITFSNKYKASNPEFLLADIIGESVRSSKSLDLNKSNYGSYVDSGAGSAIDEFANGLYDVAKHAIINSANQGLEWNSKGLFLRQRISQDSYSPEQIAMINNMIAFTDDTWETVKLAIGKFKDPNVGDTWGIAAPNITGTLFAGKNLVIENTVLNEDGTQVVKQFKVDATGAWLNNSALFFSQEPRQETGYAGGKMMIDPRYGIAAGNLNLYEGTGTEIKPSFIDEEGNIIFDEAEKGNVPINTSLFFDINHNKAYFKGDIYAENGYFAGTIDATNIIAGTLKVNGKDIIDGTIDADDKLTGNIDSEQMYANIIEAINRYIDFVEQNGEEAMIIGDAVIGNLDASKITTGDISADRISTNVIEAINGSFGKIDSDHLDVAVAEAGKLLVIGGNARLMINPTFGIVAGNNDLFQIDDEGNIIDTTFIKDGELVFEEGASAPKNTSFFFDINTGKAYFSGSLSASDITTGKLSSDYMEIKDAFITNAMIKNLDAEKIDAGNISADRLQANVIKAINVSSEVINGERIIFKDGYLQSAWIGNLSAEKITTGILNTNLVSVRSEDGGFNINGNTTQWTDKDGIVRLQAGQDKSGNFNFAVFGEDGKTAYFDEGGIHAEGIRDNILIDDMMKPSDGSYPGIAGDKLNINSVITSFNEDGTTTINTGRVAFLTDRKPVYRKDLAPDGSEQYVDVTRTYYTYVLDEEGNIQYESTGTDPAPILEKHVEPAPDPNNPGSTLKEIKYLQKLDSEGNPMYEIQRDQTGNPVYAPKVDDKGELIRSKRGQVVFEKEPNKIPIYIQEVDADGNPIFENSEITLDVYMNNLITDFEGNIKDMTANIEINSQAITSQVTDFTQYQSETNERFVYMQSTIEQTASSLRAEFTQSISENDESIKNLNRFIAFSAYGMEFGDQDASGSVDIPRIQLGTFPLPGESGDSDVGKLIFYSGNSAPVAWLSENQLYVTEGRINRKLFLGEFAFIPRESGERVGNLSFVKTSGA